MIVRACVRMRAYGKGNERGLMQRVYDIEGMKKGCFTTLMDEEEIEGTFYCVHVPMVILWKETGTCRGKFMGTKERA